MPRTIEDLTPGWNASTRSLVRAEALTTAFKRYRTAVAELALAEAAYLAIEQDGRKSRPCVSVEAHSDVSIETDVIEVCGEGRSLEVAVDRIEARLARMDAKIAAMAKRSTDAEVKRG